MSLPVPFKKTDSLTPQLYEKKETNYTFIILIVSVIVCGLIAYWWFKPKPKHATEFGPFVLSGDTGKPNKNSTKPIFNQSQIYSALGNNFTLSFFTYIDSVITERIPIGAPEGDFRFKPIVYILGVGDILIDPIHQTVQVRIKPLTQTAVKQKDTIVSINIDNFMISKWNQLTITVEGRTVDVYVNGVIAKSMLLDNLPILNPVGVLLETSPDFSGQAGLFQAWPHRLTESNVAKNYSVNTDIRGKPKIPDSPMNVLKMFQHLKNFACSTGLCSFNFGKNPLQYVEYEYA